MKLQFKQTTCTPGFCFRRGKAYEFNASELNEAEGYVRAGLATEVQDKPAPKAKVVADKPKPPVKADKVISAVKADKVTSHLKA
jgi:hypothetical protein